MKEPWTFNAEYIDLERVGARVRGYLLTALCLLTMAVIAFGLSAANSTLRQSKGSKRRLFGMKTLDALTTLAVIVAGSVGTVCYYTLASKVVYVEATGEVTLFSPSHVTPDVDETSATDDSGSARAVELWVPGDKAALVRQGDPVRLQFEGWPIVGTVGWFRGQVQSIDTINDGDSTVRFRILVTENGRDSWPDKRYLQPGAGAKGWVFVEFR